MTHASVVAALLIDLSVHATRRMLSIVCVCAMASHIESDRRRFTYANVPSGSAAAAATSGQFIQIICDDAAAAHRDDESILECLLSARLSAHTTTQRRGALI